MTTYTLWRSLQVFGLLFMIIMRNTCAQFTYTDESVCESPNRRPGVCISVKDCPQLVRLLQRKPVVSASVVFLQKSQCGFNGAIPKVCCEKSENELNVAAEGLNVGNPEQTNLGSSQPPSVTSHPNLRLLDHNICGPINSDRIIGGNRTGLFEFPWMALLAYRTGRPNAEFRCGGSVISKRYVLTAAHCIVNLPANLKFSGVRVGDHDITTERDCEMTGTFEEICSEKYQDFGIEKSVAHPDYSASKLHNDIALVRVDRDIDFSPQNSRPICLPIGPAARITSKKLMVSGWGVTEQRVPSPVMLKVSLPIYPQDECAAKYKSQAVIWHKQICMGGQPGMDSCGGDSGGPLQAPTLYYGNPRYVQYGLVSFGVRNCGSAGHPGVYTRLDHYLKWILDSMTD